VPIVLYTWNCLKYLLAIICSNDFTLAYPFIFVFVLVLFSFCDDHLLVGADERNVQGGSDGSSGAT